MKYYKRLEVPEKFAGRARQALEADFGDNLFNLPVDTVGLFVRPMRQLL